MYMSHNVNQPYELWSLKTFHPNQTLSWWNPNSPTPCLLEVAPGQQIRQITTAGRIPRPSTSRSGMAHCSWQKGWANWCAASDGHGTNHIATSAAPALLLRPWRCIFRIINDHKDVIMMSSNLVFKYLGVSVWPWVAPWKEKHTLAQKKCESICKCLCSSFKWLDLFQKHSATPYTYMTFYNLLWWKLWSSKTAFVFILGPRS